MKSHFHSRLKEVGLIAGHWLEAEVERSRSLPGWSQNSVGKRTQNPGKLISLINSSVESLNSSNKALREEFSKQNKQKTKENNQKKLQLEKILQVENSAWRVKYREQILGFSSCWARSSWQQAGWSRLKTGFPPVGRYKLLTWDRLTCSKGQHLLKHTQGLSHEPQDGHDKHFWERLTTPRLLVNLSFDTRKFLLFLMLSVDDSLFPHYRSTVLQVSFRHFMCTYNYAKFDGMVPCPVLKN